MCPVCREAVEDPHILTFDILPEIDQLIEQLVVHGMISLVDHQLLFRKVLLMRTRSVQVAPWASLFLSAVIEYCDTHWVISL